MEKEFKRGDICPCCEIGILKIRFSRYGKFLGCDKFPDCAFKRDIKEDIDVGMAGYKD